DHRPRERRGRAQPAARVRGVESERLLQQHCPPRAGSVRACTHESTQIRARLMSSESESQAEQRRALLDPVAQICERASVPVTRGRFNPSGPRGGGPSVVGLVCAAYDGSWDAMLTVVRAQRVPVEQQVDDRPWRRDPRTGYDLTSDGNLLYELQIHEDDD